MVHSSFFPVPHFRDPGVTMLGPRVVLPDFSVGTLEQAVEIERQRNRILASKYHLVKISGNGGIGEILRCRNCGSSHRYMSLMCVERPWSGVEDGLRAYFQVAGDFAALRYMPPAQRARHEKARRLFQPSAGLADLASSHPQMARQIQGDLNDVDVGSVAIGLLEPISKSMAQQLANRINARGLKPPFTLPGLTG